MLIALQQLHKLNEAANRLAHCALDIKRVQRSSTSGSIRRLQM